MIKKEPRIIQVSSTPIGENIRRLREGAGYRQTSLVKALQLAGYDISTYSLNRIEKGTQNPTVRLLLLLCTLLNCDMNDLFGLRGE